MTYDRRGVWLFQRRPTHALSPHRSHTEIESTEGARWISANFFRGVVVGAGIRIHQKLGPGLLESVYEVVLARDLVRLGWCVERQITFDFEGTVFEDAFRPDVIVNHALIVEVKAVRVQVFARQLLTYLKILNLPLGLLMNLEGPP